jgi:hypothetical protein
MGYHKELQNAAIWLAEIQRSDGGWGLTAGQSSSIVNTMEALYVLKRAGKFFTEIKKGLEYIRGSVFEHINERGPRIRYIAFSLLAICDNKDPSFEEDIKKYIEWLLESRNPDNGWGIERGTSSHLFSTFLALWALKAAGVDYRELEPSFQWILSKAMVTGWALGPGTSPQPVATAYALLALSQTDYMRHDVVVAGKQFLLQTSHWGPEEEVISGTVWKHSTFAFVVPALIQYGENPYSPVIAQAIRYINSKVSPSGGWSETGIPEGKTVRAQFWSVFALDAVYKAFDPSIHVPRIDAERAQESLEEPDFVKIAVRTKWAIIIPSFLYKSIAWILLLLSLIFLFGLYRGIANLPEAYDSVWSILFLSGAWFLIKKRSKYFPTFAKYLQYAIAIFSFINLAFGLSFIDLLKSLKKVLLNLFISKNYGF